MDINKQYLHGWDQPEWFLVIPILGAQFVYAILLTCLHTTGYFLKAKHKPVAWDVNIFLVVQYVGVVCGLMGLALAEP